ncbi:MAG: hypothetical protein ACREI3_00770 [Nitrospirales bacterium]
MRTNKMVMAAALAAAFGLGAVGCAEHSMTSSTPSTTGGFTSSEPATPTDKSSGPAHRMVNGKVMKVHGSYMDVEEYTGNVVRLYLSGDTVKINGDKKPGDMVRAEVTKGGHANSIQ